MKITVNLPTYGQIADYLQRSSPGLQTKVNLVRYLIQQELEAAEEIKSVVMLNNGIRLHCTEGTEKNRCIKAARSILRRNFEEILGIDLSSFSGGEEFIRS